MPLINLVFYTCMMVGPHPIECVGTHVRAKSQVECMAQARILNERSPVTGEEDSTPKKAVAFAYCETERDEPRNEYDAIVKEWLEEKRRNGI